MGIPAEAACLRDLVGTDHCIKPGLGAHCQRKGASLASRTAGPEPEVEDDIYAVLEQPRPEIVQERGEAVPPGWFQMRGRFIPTWWARRRRSCLGDGGAAIDLSAESG